MSDVLFVRVPEPLHRAVEKAAKKADLMMSQWVRQARVGWPCSNGGRMRCPECEKTGKRSTVTQGHGVTLPMGPGNAFWDEDDVYHFHDLSTTAWHYSCSEGHEFTCRASNKCPAVGCSFGAEAAGVATEQQQ